MVAAMVFLFLVFLILNTIAFVLVFVDHKSAYLGRQRVSEMVLLNIALLGGWLGCLTGTAAFRHKTRKQPFVTYLAFATAANIWLSAIVLNWIYAAS